jgi:hypothetical protein
LLELARVLDGAGGDGLRFPCAAAIAGGRDPVPALLAGGAARFRANVARLRHDLELAPDEAAREQVVYEALAETLGYSRNAAPLRALARAVPLREVRKSRVLPAPRPLAVLGTLVLSRRATPDLGLRT